MDDRLQLEKDYWNLAAQDKDLDRKYISDISTEEMVYALGEIPEGVGVYTLDLGCGVGRIVSRLLAYPDKTSTLQIFGIDISEEMLAVAKKRHESYHFKICDGRTIPYENNYFSFAYSVLLFQHLEGSTIYGYMQEVNRVLKPGGIFRFQYIPGTEQEPFSRHYDTRQIRKWLKLSGLEFVKEDEGLCHPQWSWVTARKPDHVG